MGVGASVNKSSKDDGGKVNKPDQAAGSHKKQSSVISSANDSNNNNNNQRASKRITSWNTNKKQQPTADSNNNDTSKNNLTPLSPPVSNSTTENANQKSTRFSTASGSSGHGSGSSAPNIDALNNSIGSSGGGGGRTVSTKFNSLRNLMRMNIFENSKVEPEELIGMKGDALNPIPEASNSRHNSSHHSNRNSNRSVSERKYSMSEATEKLIINALSESNYLSSTPPATVTSSAASSSDGADSTSTTNTAAATNNNNNSKHIEELILRRLEKEEFDADDVIIREGEKGDRIYIIESGVVRVTQQNIEIREMTVGSLFGDIALTYNALRTATVTCVTKTIVWSLRRDAFKRIQENSTSDIDKRRTEWLINIPEFAILSALDQAKLVGCLQPRVYDIGDYIYREDEISNQCVLIEHGLAAVFSSKSLVSEEDDDIDKELFIYRHMPLNTAALNKANGLQTGMSGKRRNSIGGETRIGGSGGSTNNLSGKRRSAAGSERSTDSMGNSNSNKNDNDINNPALYRSKTKVSKINEMISKIVQSTFKKKNISPPSPSKANAHTASIQSLLTLSQKQKATQTLSQKNILGSSAKPSMGSSNSMSSSVSDNAANNSSSSNSTTVSGSAALTSNSHHESTSPRESTSNSSTNILNNSNSRTSLSSGNIIANTNATTNNNNGSPSNKYITIKNNTNSNKTGGGSNANSPIKSSILKSSNVNVNNHISHNYSQSVSSGSNSASSASASTCAHSDDPSILLSHPSSQPSHAYFSTTYSQKQLLYQQHQKSDVSIETFITMLNEGCVVGVGILRGKANIPGAWPWLQQQQSQQSSSSSSEKGVGGERISINSIDAINFNSSGRSNNNGTIGAIVPISVIATERVEALILTVDAFENAFGTIDAKTTAANSSASGSNSDNTASGSNGGTVLIGGITLKSRSNSQNDWNSQIKSTSSEASLNSSVNNRSLSNFSTTTSATTDTKKMLTFTHHRKIAVEDKPIPLKKFTESQFQQSVILGNGSYGIVVLGEYKRTSSTENSNIDLNTSTTAGVAVNDKNNRTATTPALSIMDLTIQNRNKQQQQANSSSSTSNQPAYNALKIISKNDIVEMGQVRHVVDEMKLLSLMSSRFIIKLYGTYQTLNEIVLVTEVVYGCDLWSIIYDQANFVQLNNNADSGNNNNNNNNKNTGYNMGGGMTHSSSNSHLMTQQNNSNSNIDNQDDSEPLLGLPMSLVQFYVASLIAALAHIHDKGVVYRDIKPENIMIDEKGYIRLIDFGFAKKVPYTKIMKAIGQERVFVKTYTLCGTPEYLSPEMIFNLGHDQSTDIWSVGILIHEMIVAATPFAPKRADNITELFTNIALVKKTGYTSNAELLSCAGSGNAVIDLIEQMLQAEPTKRIGAIKQSTWSILRHLFFLGFPMNKIHDGSYIPEYLPRKPELFESVVNSTATREYKGDQAVFKDF